MNFSTSHKTERFFELETVKWVIARLHGVLIVLAGLLGFVSATFFQLEEVNVLLASFYGALVLIGLATTLIKSNLLLFVSCVALVAVVYLASFGFTNSYYLPIGAYILYVDVVMIMVIFFGALRGFMSMVVILGALSIWLLAIEQSWIDPVVLEPNIFGNALFNTILSFYFVLIAFVFRRSTLTKVRQLEYLQEELSQQNQKLNASNQLLDARLGQVEAVHQKHVNKIGQYLRSLKVELATAGNPKELELLLTRFLALIDQELIKISILLRGNETIKPQHTVKNKHSESDYLRQEDRRIVFLLMGLYSLWFLILNFSALSWFSIIVAFNVVLAVYGYVKMVGQGYYLKGLLSLATITLIAAYGSFTDAFNGSPVLDSSAIFLGICYVYSFTSRHVWWILALLLPLSIIRYLFTSYTGYTPPLEVTYTGGMLLVQLLPLMWSVYLITKQFVGLSQRYLKQQNAVVVQAQAINRQEKSVQEALKQVFDALQQLSDFNAHQLRSPVARSTALIMLINELGEEPEELLKVTGKESHQLMEEFIQEFEDLFLLFDQQLNQYRSLKM